MHHTVYDWARAHAHYAKRSIHDETSWVEEQERLWGIRQTAMPHGHLIENNAFFKSLNDNKLYVIHGTRNYEQITNSGLLYASAGCLVGSIYCAQVYKEGDYFRMHNLGDYILHQEVPNILKSHRLHCKEGTILLFEIDLPKTTNKKKAGIDYLRMGSIHYGLYDSLRYLLTDDERESIEDTIISILLKSKDFLLYSNRLFLGGTTFTPETARNYLDKVSEEAAHLNMLGYLYFEATSEYLMLNSTDEKTIALAKKGEFNNWLYKHMMYHIYENLKGDFNIHRFHPSVERLFRYFQQEIDAGRLKINVDDAVVYIAERILFWINTRFFSEPGSALRWPRSETSFDAHIEAFRPLIGHLIHRQLRTHHRYREFYFYFDQSKALEIWNYWNKEDVAISFNGVFPKGEIGINPAFHNLTYKVFKAEPCEDDVKNLRIVEEVDLRVVPRLVDLNESFLRAGGHYSLKNQRRR